VDCGTTATNNHTGPRSEPERSERAPPSSETGGERERERPRRCPLPLAIMPLAPPFLFGARFHLPRQTQKRQHEDQHKKGNTSVPFRGLLLLRLGAAAIRLHRAPRANEIQLVPDSATTTSIILTYRRNGQRRSWGRRRRLRLLSVAALLLVLCSCEWFVLLSCACDLLIFCHECTYSSERHASRRRAPGRPAPPTPSFLKVPCSY